MSRRGFTLTELLVALTLTTLITELCSAVLAQATVRLRQRGERAGSEHALRVSAAALRASLEAAGRDGPGLLALSAQGFSAPAIRAAGTLCQAAPGLLLARSSAPWWSATREPVAGRDSLAVARPDSGSWRSLALAAAPRSGRCPDGSAALLFPVSGDSLLLDGLGDGSPLRVMEWGELRLYRSGSDDWLGLRLLAGGGAIQPLAGPLAGLEFHYLRQDGAPALSPAEVAAVSVRAAARSDSLTLFVVVR